jgi:hypothetical protein
MTDVFISYVREDIGFVRELHKALTAADKTVWVDWDGIPFTAEWRADVQDGILGADHFVFVISPDSVASAACMWELAHATENNKRLVPIVRRRVSRQAVPRALAQLNWIFLRQAAAG